MLFFLKFLCPIVGLALIAYVGYGVSEFEAVEDPVSVLVLGLMFGVLLQIPLMLVPRALERGFRYRVVVSLCMVPGFVMVGSSSYEYLAQLGSGEKLSFVWPAVMLPATIVYGLATAALLRSLQQIDPPQ